MSNRRVTAVFMAATAAYWGSLYTYVPILSPYSQHLGASFSMVGLIVAAYGLSQLLLRIPTGIYSDRLGLRRPFLWAGCLAAMVAAAGMFVSVSPMQVLIYRGVSGVAAAMWVAFTVLFASYYPQEQTTRAVGILMFCSSTAQLTATYIGGWLTQYLGWRAPFAAAVLLAAVGFALVFLVQEQRSHRSQTLNIRELLQVGKNSRLLTVSLLGAFSQYVTFVTVYGFTPSYASSLGATQVQLGTLTLISSIPAAVASLLGGTWLANRLGERRLVASGFALAGLATISIPYMHGMGSLYVTQALGGVGRGVVFPVLMAMSIKTVLPEKKATAMGFFQSIYALGMTFGPAISGFAGDFLGMSGIFLSAGAIGCLAGAVSWVLLNWPKQQPPKQTALTTGV